METSNLSDSPSIFLELQVSLLMSNSSTVLQLHKWAFFTLRCSNDSCIHYRSHVACPRFCRNNHHDHDWIGSGMTWGHRPNPWSYLFSSLKGPTILTDKGTDIESVPSSNIQDNGKSLHKMERARLALISIRAVSWISCRSQSTLLFIIVTRHNFMSVQTIRPYCQLGWFVFEHGTCPHASVYTFYHGVGKTSQFSLCCAWMRQVNAHLFAYWPMQSCD